MNPKLFKHIFPPMLTHSTLMHIGKVVPCGPFLPFTELETRIAARVVAGKLSLPSKAKMFESATQDMEWRRKHWGEHSERVDNSSTSSIKLMK